MFSIVLVENSNVLDMQDKNEISTFKKSPFIYNRYIEYIINNKFYPDNQCKRDLGSSRL